jgi:photosystem II stability/assembly factor-like uncharacterized protein
VLEAVIIAAIMVSSVVYIATLSTPPAPAVVRADLTQRAQDALNLMADTPSNASSFGDSMLSAYIAQCLQKVNQCKALDQELKKVLPDGASYSLSLSNGYSTFPVLENNTPPGEAVTVSHLLEPQWSYTFVGSGQTVYEPDRDAMTAYALPVFDSNVLDQGGSPLRVLLHGTSGGANVTLSTFASTQALTSSSSAAPAVSLYFVSKTGAPIGEINESGDAVTPRPDIYPSGANLNFTLRVEESAGSPMPAGTELRLEMPRAWNASASGPLNAGWTILSYAANALGGYNNTTLLARTNATLTSGHLDFRFNATYQGDPNPDYLFHATLSHGALAESNLVVRGNTSTSSSYAMPVFAVSTPRPMGGPGVTTTWTVGLGLPASPAVVVQSIEIIEQDGRPIFGANPTVVAGWGTVVSDNDRLVWTPGDTSSPTSALSLAFHVTPSGTVASPTTLRPAFEPPLSVGGWTTRYAQQIAGGFWRQTVMPRNATYGGYDTTAAPSGTNHTLGSEGSYKGLTLPGTTNYTVGNVNVNTSTMGSYVGVEKRTVATGETAIVDIDVQSLLFQLSQAGLNTSVSLHIYPPWSGDSRIPIANATSFDTELLQSDVVSMTATDLNGDGYADPILGTSNGRILALHALTGGRLEGDVFSAPALEGAHGSTAPAITLLRTISLGGATYVVAATDQGSVFVLDGTLHQVWSWFYGNGGGSNLVANVISIDTSVDIDGTDGGRADLVAGVEVRNPSTSAVTDYVYVLRAVGGDPSLETWPAGDVPFYNPTGQPDAVLSLPEIGPAGGPGIATTYQYTPGTSQPALPSFNTVPPTGAGGLTTLPRAGLRGVTADGRETWLIGGAPVTLARAYDWEGDKFPDVVAGEPAGYVVMANGSLPAAPLGGLLLSGPTELIAASTHDRLHAAALSRDGTAIFTTDGWTGPTIGIGCVAGNCQLTPGLTGIAANASSSFWISGPASTLLHSNPAYSANDLAQGLGVTVVTPNVTKDGAAYSLLPVVGTVYNFNDVWFRYDAEKDTGFAIGTPATCPALVLDCGSEALVLKTTNGGQTWWAASHTNASLASKTGGTVTAPLAHLNFTDDSLGWITGAGGTLLRTRDGGATWKGLDVNGTTTNLTRIACVPENRDVCVVVGEAGSAWMSTNATANVPGWTSMPQVTSLVTSLKTITSVGWVNASVGFLGASNLVLQTWDGGVHWSALPLSYIPGTADVVNALPDGTGFIYGGNAGQARIFQFAHYNMTSRAQTRSLSAAAGIPAGAQITHVAVQPSEVYSPPATNGAMIEVYYNVSANGGANWTPVQVDGGFSSPTASSHMEWGSAVPDSINGYEATPSVKQDDLRVRMDFATSGDLTAQSAVVRGIDLVVSYDVGGVAQTPVTYHVDLNQTTDKDWANTDATWLPGMGGVSQRLANSTYWVANVSGSVQDVIVGENVPGSSDARPEVYAATGDVVAANSPDSIPYAANDEGLKTGVDDSVYVLDGKTGAILAKRGPFDGAVTHLALSDVDGDGTPEVLYATIDGPTGGELAGLNPTTLAQQWKVSLGAGSPSALVAGKVRGPTAAAFASTRTTSGPTAKPGSVGAYVAADGSTAWNSVPDVQGHYTVSVPVPKDWLFGPYVVEADVDWRTTGYGIDLQSQSPVPLVQTERFYDYFLVTPPGALAPPSPVYNVQLTVWYNDWR